VHDELVGGNTCAQRKLELAERRDVGADPLLGQEAQERDARKRFRPVDDDRLRRGRPVRPRPRAQRLLAVDDERRPEPLGELGGANAADRELAVLDRRGIREEVEQRYSRQ
jgi:hypothetical protein